METMQIRQANIEDLPQLLALYDHARIFMAEHGNPAQWEKTTRLRSWLKEISGMGTSMWGWQMKELWQRSFTARWKIRIIR